MTRTRRADPAPVFPAPPFPDDARMFFCIGAQKAGTTWLHDYLSASDQVHFSPNKELHYFDVRAGRADLALELRLDLLRKQVERLVVEGGRMRAPQLRRLRETVDLLSIYTGPEKGRGRHTPYLRYLLKGRKAQPVVGDITPAYAVLDAAHFADMASIGQAKFIFLLRDPIARMWSQIRMAVRVEQGEDLAPDVMARLCAERAQLLIDSGRLRGLERADYLRTMSELESAVPAGRILYVFYEELFSGDGPRRICDFLGIPALPAESARRVNEGVSVPLPEPVRAAFRAAFAPQYDGLRARFGTRLPARWEV